ncbi:hypothetical protein Oweho_0678 [Owenweeksia hongkongensis DSM 17368]|uniref:Uncharacterized protein n=1 Tax=Owenweeksia hongkongensis (strain DSM 17368 / CIP 108786 / JCM 12287 / NRRL B-23963 / UST20020801) TaxID=926562 RepID=G8R121_OWEHD|nr:hypothetical protein [Owenweeksia hongkongensis]AEV31692.1 hypothetical protein Oweho_0678 [Owenweeksia hongkongensis DSM 17368]
MKQALLFTLIIFGLFNSHIQAQCRYDSKVQEFRNKANNAGTKESSNGSQGYFQYANYYEQMCWCESELSDADMERLVATINGCVQIVNSQYSSLAGKLPTMTKAKCKGMSKSSSTNNSTNSNSQSPSLQQDMMQLMNNFNNAMSLKRQGEAMAHAFANEVKRFGELGTASNPQELLNNFNHNMSQISELQAQNKIDNLNQIGNTAVSALNDLNSGNTDGALLSAAAYLDQREAQKEAQREAEYQKQKLIQQHKEKMSQFYWKAVELNDQSINAYYRNAAFTFSKNEENYNLAYVAHHQCFADYMKNNFSYSNTLWTQNNCAKPQETFSLENNLIPLDVQYINTAKRKYQLYTSTGSTYFKEAAVRFAGSAVDEKPSAEYFYLMGHYAGIDDPIVAFTAFETAKEMDAGMFNSTEKYEEYMGVKLRLSYLLKEAIDNNDVNYLKIATAASLHKTIDVYGMPAIAYAIQQDNPDAVQLFLNDYIKDQTQYKVKVQVRETMIIAAINNSEATLQRFVEMDFSVDYKIKSQTPFEAARKAQANDAAILIAINSKHTTKYQTQIIDAAAEAHDYITLRKLQRKTSSTEHSQRITNLMTDFDEKAYAKASEINTKESYEYYISNFPLGKYLNDARSRISKIEETRSYNLVVEYKSIDRAKEFLQNYPESKYAKEVQLLLFDQLYEQGNSEYASKETFKAKSSYKAAYELKEAVENERPKELRNLKSQINTLNSHVALHFEFDSNGGFGFGTIGLKTKGVGFYWTGSLNVPYAFSEIPIYILDEDNVLKKDAGGPENSFIILDKTESIRSAIWLGLSLGATYKIAKPLWLSAGVGVGAYGQVDSYTFKEANNPSDLPTAEVQTQEVHNKVESGAVVYFEAGAYFRITKGLFLKGGVTTSSKMTFVQFGIATSIFKY